MADVQNLYTDNGRLPFWAIRKKTRCGEVRHFTLLCMVVSAFTIVFCSAHAIVNFSPLSFLCHDFSIFSCSKGFSNIQL